jgi:pyrroline-5-carboxylate reductase
VKIIAQAQAVITLFEDLGTAPVIDEKWMPLLFWQQWNSFCLRYIRASMQAGIEIGFDWKTALAISAQTVKGGRNANGTSASEQLIDSDDSKGSAPLPDLMKWKCMGLAPH